MDPEQLQLPDLPGPDDVVVGVLIAIFGSGAFVVVLFKLLMFVLSWYGAAKDTGRATRKVQETAGRVGSQVAGFRPLQVAVRAVGVVASLLLQFAWLYMSYLVGNLLSLLIRYLGSEAIVTVDTSTWPKLVSVLTWNRVSLCSVLAALLALVLTYLLDAKVGRAFLHIATAPAWLVGLYIIVLVLLTFLLACLQWLLRREFDLSASLRDTFGPSVTGAMVILAACALYIATGRVATSSAQWIQSMLRPTHP